jgi:hypothetical protein
VKDVHSCRSDGFLDAVDRFAAISQQRQLGFLEFLDSRKLTYQWKLDVPGHLLRFEFTDQVSIEIPCQFIGTFSQPSRSFLWATANSGSNFVPESLVFVRQLADAQKGTIAEFGEGMIDDVDASFGHMVGTICVGLSGNQMDAYYVCPHPTGFLLVVFKFAEIEASLNRSLTRVNRCLIHILENVPLRNYRVMVRALFEENRYRVADETDGSLVVSSAAGERVGTVTFDAHNRIESIALQIGCDCRAEPHTHGYRPRADTKATKD